MAKAYLLDLNFTLVENSRSIFDSIDKKKAEAAGQDVLFGGAHDPYAAEVYREWLIDLLRTEYVIMVTVRDEKDKAVTLDRIEAAHDWRPDEAYFRPDRRMRAAEWKEHVLLNHVQGRFAFDEVFGLESNQSVHEMYRRHGVRHSRVPYRPPIWTELPR